MTAADSPFTLSDAIDPATLRPQFEATGRVQIPDFLADGASALREHLLAREDWELAAKTGSRLMLFGQERLKGMSAAHREGVLKLTYPADLETFGHALERLHILDDPGVTKEDTLLAAFALFMSSDPVLDLVRSITGVRVPLYADAQGTRYRAGHFAARHHDRAEGSKRQAAYVFNLTETWRPEWGGLLMFHDDNRDVTRALVPRWNALNLFRVPQDHSVSLVAPFAPASRLSVTGWFRELRA